MSGRCRTHREGPHGCWLRTTTPCGGAEDERSGGWADGREVVEVEGTDGGTAASEVTDCTGETREDREGRTREEARAVEEGGVVIQQ